MRLGILSDAHGNVEAFEQALGILTEARADAVYFLGDAVGYIPDKGVVSILRGSNIQSIRGNHEDMLVRQSATADQDIAYRHRETFSTLSVDERDFIMSWPSQLSISHQLCTLLLVHGSPRDQLGGYIYPDSSLSEFSAVRADVVFMGHTHRPFVRQCNGKLFVNVGSCGFPRGEDLRGSVCIFDLPERSAKIIRFDISGSCSRILSRYSLSPPVTSLLERCSSYKMGNDIEE
jgi:putative phosphoesterase